MSDFQPGEIVTITIKGARVVEVCRHGDGNGHDLRFQYAAPDGEQCPSSVWADAPGVTVERAVPAEWPPQPGDLWRDKHGELWFIHKNPYATRPEPDLMGRTTNGARWTDDVRGLMADNAPLTLVHREERGDENTPAADEEEPDGNAFTVGPITEDAEAAWGNARVGSVVTVYWKGGGSITGKVMEKIGDRLVVACGEDVYECVPAEVARVEDGGEQA